MKPYHITNNLAVHPAFAIRLAALDYNPGSNRPDDCGSLWVAPVATANWDAPVGLLAIYTTTSGDPLLIGQIEDGEVSWLDSTDNTEALSEHMRSVVLGACWLDDKLTESGAELAELVRDSVPLNA